MESHRVCCCSHLKHEPFIHAIDAEWNMQFTFKCSNSKYCRKLASHWSNLAKFLQLLSMLSSFRFHIPFFCFFFFLAQKKHDLEFKRMQKKNKNKQKQNVAKFFVRKILSHFRRPQDATSSDGRWIQWEWMRWWVGLNENEMMSWFAPHWPGASCGRRKCVSWQTGAELNALKNNK